MVLVHCWFRICLVLGVYSSIFFGHALPEKYTMNFLFTGLPFFLLGELLSNVYERKNRWMRNQRFTEPSMTRFIMSLDEAVDLVLFAFEKGVSGDILVQKAPACTIEVLAKAITELFEPGHEIRVIGIRHGEKMYETLLTNEECEMFFPNSRRLSNSIRSAGGQCCLF